MRPPGGGASPAMSFTRDGYESVCAHFQPSHADSARPPSAADSNEEQEGKINPFLEATVSPSPIQRKETQKRLPTFERESGDFTGWDGGGALQCEI